jgi:mevalonate pyrophosphate decarboxylase
MFSSFVFYVHFIHHSKQKDKTSTTAHNVNEPLYDVWTEHKDKTIEHNVNEPYMMYEMNNYEKKI